MIELKITADTAAELFEQLQGLARNNEPKATRIEFPKDATLPVYQPDADDEAEVVAEAVQGDYSEEVAFEVVSNNIDSAGEAWDEAIHSPNKTTTKDGRWRLKKGAVRPEQTDAPSPTVSTSAGAEPTPEEPIASPSEPEAEPEEEDEFAAFAEAVKETGAVDVPARTWTDADLSKLCNQAAQKLGGPEQVKKLIADYAAEGEVPHSRNVPVEKREEFAQAIEAAAGIKYAG